MPCIYRRISTFTGVYAGIRTAAQRHELRPATALPAPATGVTLAPCRPVAPPPWRPPPRMTVFVIRRLMQSLVVLLAMSLLVFVGVFAIGNPIEILINPQADQAEIARATAAFG